MKQKDVLTKNNDLLNVMFRGTPCSFQDEKCRLMRNLSLSMLLTDYS